MYKYMNLFFLRILDLFLLDINAFLRSRVQGAYAN